MGTPNEQVWPGVGKLPNWHEYPQWSPKDLSSSVPTLGADGLDLLSVSHDNYLILTPEFCMSIFLYGSIGSARIVLV